MNTATLTVTTPFPLAPADSARPARRTRTVRQQPDTAPATGLFSRLERETTLGSRPESLVFILLTLAGVAWPAYEALRVIAGF